MMKVSRKNFDAVMMPNYAPSKVIPVNGQGSQVWDAQGQHYIDFAGGIAVSCLGHCHPALVSTITEQSNKLWHLSNVMTNEPAIELAQKIVRDTFADKVYFCNSGAEANEAALKLARRWAFNEHGLEKSQIIAFKSGFHGRTFFTVSVGGQPSYSEGFGPKPEGICHAEFNNLASVESLISDKTCAVVVEPVQGEGGVVPATVEFMRGLRALCDKHKALLVFDEVQTGVGRTGTLYAYQHFGVEPDILSTAKAFGGGFPIGATIATDAVAKHFVVGTHGSTYGGNPLACSVANAVWDTVNQAELLADVAQKSILFFKGLNHINQQYKVFSEIRGKGLLIGAVLNNDYKGKARELMNHALDEGLMVLVAGANVVRFTPSLVIPNEDITDGLKAFSQAVKQLING